MNFGHDDVMFVVIVMIDEVDDRLTAASVVNNGLIIIYIESEESF